MPGWHPGRNQAHTEHGKNDAAKDEWILWRGLIDDERKDASSQYTENDTGRYVDRIRISRKMRVCNRYADTVTPSRAAPLLWPGTCAVAESRVPRNSESTPARRYVGPCIN